MDDERRCSAHNRAGERCKRAAIIGGTVCKIHGGASPWAQTKATERLEERAARVILSERLEHPEPIEHPVYELLKLAAEMRAWQAILRERLDTLDELNLEDRQGVDRERALVNLYRSGLNDLGKLLVDMAKLDLKARAMTLQQETAAQVLQAVSEALRRTGLSQHEPTVKAELANVLRGMTVRPETTERGTSPQKLAVRALEP